MTIIILFYVIGGLFIFLSIFGIFNVHGQSEERKIAHLNGSQVMPSTNTNASGKAIFDFVLDEDFLFSGFKQVSYNITVQNISDINLIDIHNNKEKRFGLSVIEIPISPNEINTDPVAVYGNITNQDTFSDSLAGKGESSLDALKREVNNGEIYIDIHTSKYPEGEIRGQLYPSK